MLRHPQFRGLEKPIVNALERFRACMAHLPPDRPPLDLGATTLTGMRPACGQRLLDVLGFTGASQPTNSGVDERILQWAGVGFRGVGGIVDLPSPHTRRLSTVSAIDCWGVGRDRIAGEWQITEAPLRGATREDLAAFPWPEPRIDERALMRWEAQAQALQATGEHVVIAEHPVYGILELGCWMCGYDDFLIRLAADPDFVRDFFDRVLAIQLDVIDTYYRVLGPYVHLTTSGDDFGTQGGPLISPATFEALIAPYMKARIERTKAIARCYYWHHTCGSVFKLLPQLIACGVDILNPVQVSAAGMAPERLKETFGNTLVFWGGVDVQHVLPFASPDQVREEVRHLIAVLGRDGGLVVAPTHELQDDIPPEAIIAWIEAARDGS